MPTTIGDLRMWIKNKNQSSSQMNYLEVGDEISKELKINIRFISRQHLDKIPINIQYIDTVHAKTSMMICAFTNGDSGIILVE